MSNVICGKSVWLMGCKLNVVSEPALELWRGYESLANFQNCGTPYPTALFHFNFDTERSEKYEWQKDKNLQ